MEEKNGQRVVTLYAIYDMQAKRFGNFMFSDSDVNAVRTFLSIVGNSVYVSEYMLYSICKINPDIELTQEEIDNDTFLIDGDNSVSMTFNRLIRDWNMYNITPSEEVIERYRTESAKLNRRYQ